MSTLYFDMEDVPVVWTDEDLPQALVDGQWETYYNIERVLNSGIEITKAEFAAMVEDQTERYAK